VISELPLATVISEVPVADAKPVKDNIQQGHDVVTFQWFDTNPQHADREYHYVSTKYNSVDDAFFGLVKQPSLNTSTRITKTIFVNKDELQQRGDKLIYELSFDKLRHNNFRLGDILYNITSNVNTTFTATTGFTYEIDVNDIISIPVIALCYSHNSFIFDMANSENLEINLTYDVTYLCPVQREDLHQQTGYMAIDKNDEYFVHAQALISKKRIREQKREKEKELEREQKEKRDFDHQSFMYKMTWFLTGKN
jgi:hypothetical protein